jgi:hypothetical protein
MCTACCDQLFAFIPRVPNPFEHIRLLTGKDEKLNALIHARKISITHLDVVTKRQWTTKNRRSETEVKIEFFIFDLSQSLSGMRRTKIRVLIIFLASHYFFSS